jgi:hypothetical protein
MTQVHMPKPDKKILVLKADGTTTELTKKPTLKEMQRIVGGYIEFVRVLDHIENGKGVYATMYVNEDGLSQNLPRNENATKIYQRNTRLAFPDAENPFLEARKQMEKRISPGAVFINLVPDEYELDPYVVGDAIFFQGYTVEEADV